MNTTLRIAIIVAGIFTVSQVTAGEKTVVLEVDGMTCASCPYIVKQSLASVAGVSAVEVSFADKVAVVSFDDGKTDVGALTGATSGMGFPSTVKE